MKTMTTVRLLAALAAVSLIGACSTTLGRNFDDKYAQEIKPGETTKAEVVSKLGRPALRRGTEKEEIWTYAYYTGPGFLGNLFSFSRNDDELQEGAGRQIRLVVTFKDDVVQSSRFTQELPQR